MDSGKYCHIGFSKALNQIIKGRLALVHTFNTINLFINIDGAPITGKSSEKGIWTILCKDSNFGGVYVVGMYFGVQKPENSDNFLNRFVKEASELLKDGYKYNDKSFSVEIHGLVCDAPAKAFILNTKYPSGYSSCTKCDIEGEYYASVCFPLSNIKELMEYCNVRLRTDEKFKNLEYIDDYQKGSTVLNNLPGVGLVTNVPLDPMHLVYIGVMKQLIKYWVGSKGRANKTYKLSDKQITVISDRLNHLSLVLPSDFNRRCRSLSYWKIWKAT